MFGSDFVHCLQVCYEHDEDHIARSFRINDLGNDPISGCFALNLISCPRLHLLDFYSTCIDPLKAQG